MQRSDSKIGLDTAELTGSAPLRKSCSNRSEQPDDASMQGEQPVDASCSEQPDEPS